MLPAIILSVVAIGCVFLAWCACVAGKRDDRMLQDYQRECAEHPAAHGENQLPSASALPRRRN